ncbi:hypothetical protein [Bacillus atrophaeus]|uniref:hypothetical protein n=1 Tax=Bacillus atrophaeus TaxID=1452 RepID=UPI002E23D874|nr:hypothetical protein [Bacillus atrophaeus]
MKKVSVFLLGVIGIMLIVYFSKDHEDYTANSYVQEGDVNDDLGEPNDEVNSEKNEHYDQSEENEQYEEYDSIAYRLSSQEVGNRNGQQEYKYSAYYVPNEQLEVYGKTANGIVNEEDKEIKFWRYDVDFVPKKWDLILVKYPKGNHKKFIDIDILYSPIGEPFQWDGDN